MPWGLWGLRRNAPHQAWLLASRWRIFSIHLKADRYPGINRAYSPDSPNLIFLLYFLLTAFPLISWFSSCLLNEESPWHKCHLNVFFVLPTLWPCFLICDVRMIVCTPTDSWGECTLHKSRKIHWHQPTPVNGTPWNGAAIIMHAYS